MLVNTLNTLWFGKDIAQAFRHELKQQIEDMPSRRIVARQLRISFMASEVRVSNSKLLQLDPNKLNGVQMNEMYTTALCEATSAFVPLHKRTKTKEFRMKEQIKRHYNMRVMLTLKNPEDSEERRQCIKEWTQVLYMIDNNFSTGFIHK